MYVRNEAYLSISEAERSKKTALFFGDQHNWHCNGEPSSHWFSVLLIFSIEGSLYRIEFDSLPQCLQLRKKYIYPLLYLYLNNQQHTQAQVLINMSQQEGGPHPTIKRDFLRSIEKEVQKEWEDQKYVTMRNSSH